MKNKKIIWLHSHFNYWMGGTKYVYEVISELKNDYTIICAVEDFNQFSDNKYKEIGIKINRLNFLSSNSIIYWVLMPAMLLIDLFYLKKIIKDQKLNYKNSIIISSMFPMNFIAKLTGLKHIQLCFEPFAFFYDDEFISKFSIPKKIFIKIIKFLYSPLDFIATRSADKILTLNSVTKRLMKEVFDVESELTQAGVNSDLFKPYISKRISDQYKNIPIVIHSTDYSPIKGTDRVISAFAIAKKKAKNAKLLITSTIKNETAEQKLKNQARQLKIDRAVEFLGFVDIEDLPQLYTIASVLVQGSSSLKSGTTSMALPVKEAMCCETPAIRPDAGGEDVINGKTGFLVDPRDTNLLAEKMTLLLLDDKLSKKMGKLARKDIINRYTWKNTTTVFSKSIKKVFI